jgi:SAM-dependent methyltransferase
MSDFPDWARALLADESGVVDGGVMIFDFEPHEGVTWYEGKGGTFFLQRRAEAAFAMSAIDTPVYGALLEAGAPGPRDAVIADVGCGDGRVVLELLDRGHERILAVDPILDSLRRLRAHLEEHRPDDLDKVALVRADARTLPFHDDSVEQLLAIEALCYLNEDYEVGLADCARVVKPGGTLRVSERSRDGALLTRLLYGGVEGFLEMRGSSYVLDGPKDNLVRSRCFRPAELREAVEATGLEVTDTRGISVFSLVTGFLNGLGRVPEELQDRREELTEAMVELADESQALRTILLTAEKPAA